MKTPITKLNSAYLFRNFLKVEYIAHGNIMVTLRLNNPRKRNLQTASLIGIQ